MRNNFENKRSDRCYTMLIVLLLIIIPITITNEILNLFTINVKLLIYIILITNILLVLKVEKNSKKGRRNLTYARQLLVLSTCAVGSAFFFFEILTIYFSILLIPFMIALILYAVEEIISNKDD